MLKKDKLKLAEGLIITKVSEQYYGHSIININISLARDFDLKQFPGILSSYLSEKGIVPVFSLLFISEYHRTNNAFKAFLEYADREIQGIVLLSGFNGKSELQLVCAECDKVQKDNGVALLSSALKSKKSVEYLYFNSVNPSDPEASRYTQTYSVFSSLNRLMTDWEMSFDRIGRTWIYTDRILDWYDDLNRARSKFFDEEDLFNKFIPASTGIGASNITGSSIVTSALSVFGTDVKVRTVDSPLQCTALDYKSSFSRGVLISIPGADKLMVSGTASIAPGGETIHIGEVNKQIETTMEVVSAILSENNMSFCDVSRAIAYFPEESYAENFDSICNSFGLDPEFVLKVNAVVCREDLLFEIEVDAVKKL